MVSGASFSGSGFFCVISVARLGDFRWEHFDDVRSVDRMINPCRSICQTVHRTKLWVILVLQVSAAISLGIEIILMLILKSLLTLATCASRSVLTLTRTLCWTARPQTSTFHLRSFGFTFFLRGRGSVQPFGKTFALCRGSKLWVTYENFLGIIWVG